MPSKSRLIFKWIPLLFALLLFSVAEAQNREPENIIISPTQTLSKENKELREKVYKWSVKELQKPAGEIKAHPSALFFPGKVEEKAPRVTKTIRLSHTPPDAQLVHIIQTLGYSHPFRNNMYSTGLYAAPGEVVTVKVPKNLQGRVKVQIGCHMDNLNQWVAGGQDWRRMPLIWNSFDLNDRKTEVANPFGGLIYITCPPKEEAWSGDITIKNGVEAPYYVHGKTTPEEWIEMQQSGAPWGEMATENIIVTIPTSALKQISNPKENMALWDRVIGAEMELAQLPMPFYRAQRLVTDVHIGGGYMHSGYPIMIHHCPEVNLVSEDIMIEPQKLTEASGGGANWGFFHEIGHNMQNLDWVFDGTTEVSVNFFSLYVFDTIIGTREGAHTGVSPENTQKMMETYFAEGADFEKWKKSPFLGLILFRQIQADFGWDVFKDTFKKYHAFTPDQRPKNNQEKRDVLIGFMSQSAQRDFSGFFETWGIPVSEALKNELNKYDPWMPAGFPPKVEG